MKAAVVSIALAMLVSACGGNKLHFTQEGVPPKDDPSVRGGDFLESAWRYNSGGSFDAESGRLRPGPDDDQVVIAGTDGEVAAVSKETGERRWVVDLDTTLTAGVGTGDGLAIVADLGGTVVALDRQNGAERWRAEVGGEVLAPPVIAPGVAVIRAGDAKIVGLDTANGSLLWTVQKAIDGLSVRGTSKPLLNGRGIVAGLADGRLLAIDIDRGQVLWETPIGTRSGSSEVGRLADIDADPALLGTVLYVASYQSRVVAMALGSPRVIWSNDVSTLRNLGLDADRVYVTTDEGSIVALNRYTGETIWEQDRLAGRGLSGPLAKSGQLIVGDYEGVIYQIDPESGAIRTAQRIGGGAVVETPIALDDLVLVTSESGRVQAFTLQ
jgi:outer membrane protein assembly factor BamB